MSKLLKVVLVGAYSALFFNYLKISLSCSKIDKIELEYVFRQAGSLKKIIRDIKKHGGNATLRKLSLNFKKLERLPTDFKYILKWTDTFSQYNSLQNGQSVFVENNCEFYNCFFTSDKSLLPDRRHFDAILFDVGNSWDNHPILRAPHQYYIFTTSELASNNPICHHYFESYYNLTWTYKLDSDIRWSHFTVEDKFGKIVGPKINMKWIHPMEPTSDAVTKKLLRKKKVAAWFVSNCRSKSKREKVATNISAALAKYQLKLDIYGWCGDLMCPDGRHEECLDLLEKNYYFYLVFENAIGEDYVSEKLLYPLQHYTVPIVYGGANYSRFLPPGSYLDAKELNATELAFKMNEAMKKPTAYQNYFRWHNHYTFKKNNAGPDVCGLCRMLNDRTLGRRIVTNFRQWWYRDYKKECVAEVKRIRFRRN